MIDRARLSNRPDRRCIGEVRHRRWNPVSAYVRRPGAANNTYAETRWPEGLPTGSAAKPSAIKNDGISDGISIIHI